MLIFFSLQLGLISGQVESISTTGSVGHAAVAGSETVGSYCLSCPAGGGTSCGDERDCDVELRNCNKPPSKRCPSEIHFSKFLLKYQILIELYDVGYF